uniref:Uncharacterized protein n=1 Tax=Rangifer tarandus platyrhynchus TaxID=3082113 RepID=A0ACB0EID2_RANTA|nr:unnamed protein product [Rangifer tarandus platyrhynchus]
MTPPFSDMTNVWICVSRSGPSVPLAGNGSALRSGGTQATHLTLLLCVLVAWVPPLPAGPEGYPRGRAAVRGKAGKWEDKQVRSNSAGKQVLKNPWWGLLGSGQGGWCGWCTEDVASVTWQGCTPRHRRAGRTRGAGDASRRRQDQTDIDQSLEETGVMSQSHQPSNALESPPFQTTSTFLSSAFGLSCRFVSFLSCNILLEIDSSSDPRSRTRGGVREKMEHGGCKGVSRWERCLRRHPGTANLRFRRWFLGLPLAATSVPLSLLSGCVGGSPKESRQGANKASREPWGSGCMLRGGGRSGEPPAVQAGPPDGARDDKGLQVALSFRRAATAWELWLPFGAHQGRGTRSVLVWAFWTSWGNVLIWSYSAKPESCSVLLDLPRRETANESVQRTAGHPGPGPPEGAGHFPGPAGRVPCAPRHGGRKGVTVRAPPEATPGPVLRLGPQSLCSVCL